MKKILVTGSKGVLGQSFKDTKFQEKNNEYDFIFLDSRKTCDLTNQKSTDEYFNKIKPNFIIHLAAVSGGIGLSSGSHASMLRDNTLMCFNVLDFSKKYNIEKVLMTMTTGMYPATVKLPYSENKIHDGYPLENNYGSSFGKRIIDPAIKSYRSEYNLDVVGLILSGIYGENDNFNPLHAPMLPATLRKIHLAKEEGKKVEVWGDGSALRDYTYAKDLRDIYIWFLQNYSSSTPVNISSGEELPIKEIIKKICDIVNFDFNKVQFDITKPNGILKKTPDLSLMKSLNDFKFTKLKDGLTQTYSWFKENKDNLRIDEKK